MTVQQNKMFRGYLTGRPYPRDIMKTSCLHPVLTLHIPVICMVHASLHGKLTREILAKIALVFNCLESSHTLSLSLTQPLQLNPTINTGYNRLNKIIIKFDTKLKPTKHIVVNYNFTVCAIY